MEHEHIIECMKSIDDHKILLTENSRLVKQPTQKTCNVVNYPSKTLEHQQSKYVSPFD